MNRSPELAVPVHHILYVHFTTATGAPPGERRYPTLLALLADITPTVQALPPDAALADVGGSLRYFHRTATDLAALLRARALAHHGVDATVGVASSVLLARIAAYDGPPGAVRTAPTAPDAVAAYLAHRPVAALPGIGPATARTLCHYGLDSVGRLAAAGPTTLQRILGAPTARRVRKLARGIDPTPV
ncbi:helix-hairpin-helix domain-containing protein, partial [Streptomyces sp. E11-3]